VDVRIGVQAGRRVEGAHLKAIFTRIPSPRNVQIETLKRHKRRPPKRQRPQIKRRQRLQILCRLGPLQRQQPPVIQNLQLNLPLLTLTAIAVPFVYLLSEPGEVSITSPRVRDDVESVFRVFGYDCVVDDPAFFVEQDGEGG